MGNKFHFHVTAPVKEQIICLENNIYIYIYITKEAGTNDPSREKPDPDFFRKMNKC